MTGGPRSSFPAPLAVAFGGVAGAGVRWAVGGALDPRLLGDVPAATFAVNVVGCLALGLLLHAPPERRLPLGVGFCGGLTTMSTFAVEVATFLDDGRPVLGLAYLAASVGVGLVAILVGRSLAPAAERW